MSRLFVAIATLGRAELVRRTADLLADQSRPADGIIVAATEPADVAGLDRVRGAPEVVLGQKGLCRQRNNALRAIGERADIVIFLDDDFIAAPDFLENIERLFDQMPDVMGITGDLVADGIHCGGYTIEQAQELISARAKALDSRIKARQALYGCNMAIRLSSAKGLAFDETLPLYGWLEDIDFTYQLGMRGRLISTGLVTGVHLGTKGGRTSGRRLGYSQIANVVYLKRKGTLEPRLGEKLMRQNLISNVLRSAWPEPHIDRRGRLVGNLLGLKDWLTGRIDPRRIEAM
jgi:hypothetical protein